MAYSGIGDVARTVPPNGIDRFPLTFAPLRNLAPSSSALVPDSVRAGSDAFTLAVRGSNYVRGSTVPWNGVPLPTMYIAVTEIRVNVTAAMIALAGSPTIVVVNPSPGGGASNELSLRITASGQRRAVGH